MTDGPWTCAGCGKTLRHGWEINNTDPSEVAEGEPPLCLDCDHVAVGR